MACRDPTDPPNLLPGLPWREARATLAFVLMGGVERSRCKALAREQPLSPDKGEIRDAVL